MLRVCATANKLQQRITPEEAASRVSIVQVHHYTADMSYRTPYDEEDVDMDENVQEDDIPIHTCVMTLSTHL